MSQYPSVCLVTALLRVHAAYFNTYSISQGRDLRPDSEG